MEFLRKREDFVDLMIKHIGTSAIMDLLLRMLTCIEPQQLRQDVLNVRMHLIYTSVHICSYIYSSVLLVYCVCVTAVVERGEGDPAAGGHGTALSGRGCESVFNYC